LKGASKLRKICESCPRNSSNAKQAGALSQESIIDKELGSSPPLIRYCIKRLIKGLSSSRQCARQGFATALTGIVDLVLEPNDQALSILLTYLRQSFSKKDGQEVIGYTFGLGSLIKSNLVFSKPQIMETIEDIISIFFAKSFVREPCGRFCYFSCT